MLSVFPRLVSARPFRPNVNRFNITVFAWERIMTKPDLTSNRDLWQVLGDFLKEFHLVRLSVHKPRGLVVGVDETELLKSGSCFFEPHLAHQRGAVGCVSRQWQYLQRGFTVCADTISTFARVIRSRS